MICITAFTDCRQLTSLLAEGHSLWAWAFPNIILSAQKDHIHYICDSVLPGWISSCACGDKLYRLRCKIISSGGRWHWAYWLCCSCSPAQSVAKETLLTGRECDESAAAQWLHGASLVQWEARTAAWAAGSVWFSTTGAVQSSVQTAGLTR